MGFPLHSHRRAGKESIPVFQFLPIFYRIGLFLQVIRYMGAGKDRERRYLAGVCLSGNKTALYPTLRWDRWDIVMSHAYLIAIELDSLFPILFPRSGHGLEFVMPTQKSISSWYDEAEFSSPSGVPTRIICNTRLPFSV